MKKIFLLAAILGCTATLSLAQAKKAPAKATEKSVTAATKVAPSVSPVKAAANTSGAGMKFEKTEINYGKIVQGGDPLRKFYFKNTGKEPLIIKNAHGSCGCTVPTYPKEPIMPNESGVIEVRYDTQRLGAFTKTVTLTTNCAEETAVLTIKGEVEAQPEGTPTRTGGTLIAPQGSAH